MVMLVFSKHDRIYHHICGKLESLLWTPCLYYYTCYCCTNLDTSIHGIVSEMQKDEIHEKKIQIEVPKPNKLEMVHTRSQGTPTGEMEIVFADSDVSMVSVPSENGNQSNQNGNHAEN